MILEFLFLIAGFGILIKGADWLVSGGSALARKYKVSELAIGLTIVAFGTSMPELVVNAFAAYQGHSDIVYGNIIGSNNFNLFLILGIAGLVTPITVQSGTVWREIPFSFLAVLMLYFLANSFNNQAGIITRLDAIILLIFFAGFLYYVFRQLKNDNNQQAKDQIEYTLLRISILITGGLAFLILGGRLVVINAVSIAEALGISQTVIALTIVAAGTSLPELATSVVAALRKNNDIAVGNIIGSNIFNIFLILGVSALIKPIKYNIDFNTDLFILGLGTVLVFIFMFSGKKKKLDRWEAAILLCIFIAYTAYLVYNEMH
ncbi:MAG: calcium/sodium antiporter [Bacteroidales bacterium]|jgi:cation:H+ antiporter|nr:calcium/sodium antiporter [Bacteroidales bacterium]